MGTLATTYWAMLLAGLVGSLGHCSGMCGPLVLMVGLHVPGRFLPRLGCFLAYHGARIAVYGLFGAVAGGLGGVADLSGSPNPVSAAVSMVLGLSIVLGGLAYLGWLPRMPLEGAGRWVSRAVGRVINNGGGGGILLLGALNGLLPCGLVYSTLLVTGSTGSPGRGALGMLLFGLGTMPVLLAIGSSGVLLRLQARRIMAIVAGALLILVGVQLILRGAAAFGVLPHLRLESVMLW